MRYGHRLSFIDPTVTGFQWVAGRMWPEVAQ